MNKKTVAMIVSLGIVIGGVGIASININKSEDKSLVTPKNESSVSKEENTRQIEDFDHNKNNSKVEVHEASSKKRSSEISKNSISSKEGSNNDTNIPKAKDNSQVKSNKEDVHSENKFKAEDKVSKNEPVKEIPEKKPLEKPIINKPVEKNVMYNLTEKSVEKTVEKQTSTENSSYVAEIEQMIFNKVNEERVKSGVSPLSYSNTMKKYARIKSKDMGVRKYFSHEDPSGQLITAKMKADGVSYNVWGENIAYIGGQLGNASLANQFMTNWMNSSGHRKNILSSNFKSMGVGVYKIGNTYYATQEFMK